MLFTIEKPTLFGGPQPRTGRQRETSGVAVIFAFDPRLMSRTCGSIHRPSYASTGIYRTPTERCTLSIQEAITNSERSTSTCPVRWLLRYGIGVDAPARSAPLSLGNLIHSALDKVWAEVHTTSDLQGRDTRPFEEITKRCDAMRKQIRSGIIDPNLPVLTCEQIDEDEARAKEIIRRYMAHYQDDQIRLLVCEQAYSAKVKTPQGRRSTKTSYAGKIDKVVRFGDDPRLWVVDHKSTSKDLQSWAREHTYTSQAPTYAWLLKEATGMEVAGSVHDLISTSPFVRAEDFKRNKDGRLSKSNAWQRTDLKEVQKAFAQDAQAGLAQDWFAEVEAEVRASNGMDKWFSRHFQTVTPEELERTERELYAKGTEIRRWREMCQDLRKHVIEAEASGDRRAFQSALVDAFRSAMWEFTRNQTVCFNYGRACSYFNFCSNPCLDSTGDLMLRRAVHAELEEEVES